MVAETAYRVGGPDIAHERIDGDVVIINLANGIYYCASGVAAEVWSWLQQGLGVAAIVETAQTRYEGPADAIATAVAAFVRMLEDHALVAPAPCASRDPLPPPGDGRKPFVCPSIDIYEDLHEILMADPIHDVGEDGWPSPRERDPSS